MAGSDVAYTWSRWARNAVEHVADDSQSQQPLCGARLHPERQFISWKGPSGLASLCQRCQRKAARRAADIII